MPSNTVTVLLASAVPVSNTSFEFTVASLVMIGAFGAIVSMVARQGARGRADIASRIGGGGGKAVGAARQGARGVGPGAAAVGGGRAEQRGAVIDLDRAVGFRRAGQRQRRRIGDAVADHAAVGRERGDGRGDRRHRVDRDRQGRSRPRWYCRPHRWRWPSSCGAARQVPRGVGPGAAAVGGGRAEQRGAVIDLDRAVGLRRAGQRQHRRIGDAVADHAAVGRERGDGRGDRRIVSTVTASAAEAALVLPAASVAVAVRLWAPFASAAVV